MARANIIIDQGADFQTTITVRDTDGNIKDLANHTGYGQIRKHYLSETSYDFTIDFQNPRSSGQVTLKMSREETEQIEPGRYVYDVELTDAADIRTRLVEGIVTVTPQVTKTPVPVVEVSNNELAKTETLLVRVVSTSNGNKYTINDVMQANLSLFTGNTYIFDWSSANSHPLRFSETEDGTFSNNGVEYTNGVIANTQSYTTTITISNTTPELYYYSENESGLGGIANTPTANT